MKRRLRQVGEAGGAWWRRLEAQSAFARRALDALMLLVLAQVHGLFGAPFLYAPMGNDERYFLWEGWSVTRGLVPYRDFQEFKPPMIFLVNALALQVFGLANMRFRLLFPVLSLAGFLALVVALRTRGAGRLLILGTFPFLFALFFDVHLHDAGLNDAESPAVAFYLWGIALLLARGRWHRVRLVAGGTCLALVPLTKEPLAPMVLATWATFLTLDLAERRQDQPERTVATTFVGWTVAGVGGVLAWWLGDMLATRSLEAYVEQLRQTFAFSAQYAAQLGRTPEIPWQGDLSTSAHLAAVAALAVVGFAVAGRRRAIAVLSATAALLTSLYAITVGGAYWRHYFIMGLPGVYLVAALSIVFLGEATRERRIAGAVLSIGWAAAAVIVFARRLLYLQAALPLFFVPPLPPVPESMLAAIDEGSAPTDCIWTLGDPLLYVYGNRCDAVKEGVVLDELLSLQPGDTDEERARGERLELEAHPPKLIIYGDDPGSGYLRKQRYLDALATPFILDHHYESSDGLIFVRPD